METDREVRRDSIKESIKVNMDLVRLLTLTIIATAVGISSLLLKNSDLVIVKVMIAIGILPLSIVVMLLAILVVRNLKKLKELANV